MKSDFRRAIHIDFHTMSGIYDIDKFDAKKFATLMAEADVTYVNVFAECNIGYTYYPSKIGVVYPELNKDMLGELVEELHKKNIGVTAYINSGINFANLLKHPEWRRAQKGGKCEADYSKDGGDVYRRLYGCFNTEYADFLKAIVKEVLDNYPVDGIFLDCVPMTHCYCENCKRDMAKLNIDIDNEEQVYQFAEQVRVKFAKEIKEIVGDKHLFFNSWFEWEENINDHFELECLPNGSWTYEYFQPHAAFARGLGGDTVYMTGRFQIEWADFGGICSKASLENDMYDALCSGFSYSIGDHAHPSKGLIPKLYKDIKDIFSNLKKYQRYTEDSVYKAEIGIYSPPAQIRKYDQWKHKYICHMLDDLKYTYNVFLRTKDLEKYKLVIIPENIYLDEADAKVFEEYVNNGGKIISCGKAGLNKEQTDFALKQFKEMVEYCGKDERYHTYFDFAEQVDTELKDVSWDTYAPSIMMKAKCGEVLALDVKSYFDKLFDGERYNLYLPPEKRTGFDTAVLNGNIAHVSFDMFNAYGKYFSNSFRELCRTILNKLLPDNLIKAEELPISARATLTENEKNVNLNVKTTFAGIKGSFVDPSKGVITEHVYMPAGRKVKVKGQYKSAKNGLTDDKIVFTACGDYTEVILPEVCGFIMVVLEK